MVRSTKKSSSEVENTQNSNNSVSTTSVSVEQETKPVVEKTKRTKKAKEPETQQVSEVSVPVEQPVLATSVESAEGQHNDTIDVENQFVEQSVEFHAKLQQLGILVSSLKSEFKQLEKKFQRDLKLAQKSSNKKKRKVGNRAPSGFVKPTRISDELAVFLDKPVGTEMARTAVTKDINAYIRANNLQDKANGRRILPDKRLASLLKINPNDELTYFNLQRYMSSHFAKSTKNLENVATMNP